MIAGTFWRINKKAASSMLPFMATLVPKFNLGTRVATGTHGSPAINN